MAGGLLSCGLPGPLHWELGVLTTAPPGKSHKACINLDGGYAGGSPMDAIGHLWPL